MLSLISDIRNCEGMLSWISLFCRCESMLSWISIIWGVKACFHEFRLFAPVKACFHEFRLCWKEGPLSWIASIWTSEDVLWWISILFRQLACWEKAESRECAFINFGYLEAAHFHKRLRLVRFRANSLVIPRFCMDKRVLAIFVFQGSLVELALW